MTRYDFQGAPNAGSSFFPGRSQDGVTHLGGLSRASSSTNSSPTSISHIDTIDQARRVPHLEVSLPHNSTSSATAGASIDRILSDACSGLFLGERPPVFVDESHNIAVIPVPADRVERVCYKSYILDKRTNTRYPFTFHVPQLTQQSQQRLTIELEGAKFAWLKAQVHIRDRLYSYEPLIRVNWQPCTGAATCKIHFHYSSDSENILNELDALRTWLNQQADLVYVENLPIYVPPRNRFGLSSDQRFREIAYNHGVSLWTRTMKDSPLGPEWCTLATDNYEQMVATLNAYREYGATTKWGAKPLSTTNSSATSPLASPGHGTLSPSSESLSPISGSPPDHSNMAMNAQNRHTPVQPMRSETYSPGHVFDVRTAGTGSNSYSASTPPGIVFAPIAKPASQFSSSPKVAFGGENSGFFTTNIFAGDLPPGFVSSIPSPSCTYNQDGGLNNLLFGGNPAAFSLFGSTSGISSLTSSLDNLVR